MTDRTSGGQQKLEAHVAKTLQDGLRQLITDGCDSSEICWENLRVQTFAEAGLMTRDCGLVITLPDGSEFQLTIIQSR